MDFFRSAHPNKNAVMETKQILTADYLDILFDNRNKNYGAYVLRVSYRNRFGKALLGMLLTCLLFLTGMLLAGKRHKTNNEVLVQDVTLQNLPDEKKPDPVQPPPMQEKPPQVEIAKNTPPKIVQDELVKPDDEIKEVDKLEDTKIGTINQEGIKDEGMVAPPVEKSSGVVKAPKVDEDYDHIFINVQMPASFPGGPEAWRKFLEQNLNRDLPTDNGAPPAKYTVIVTFIVSKTGDVSDVQAENDPGYGTKAEAIRVIQKSRKWVPAEQNGHKVIYRNRQAITFVVAEQ